MSTLGPPPRVAWNYPRQPYDYGFHYGNDDPEVLAEKTLARATYATQKAAAELQHVTDQQIEDEIWKKEKTLEYKMDDQKLKLIEALDIINRVLGRGSYALHEWTNLRDNGNFHDPSLASLRKECLARIYTGKSSPIGFNNVVIC
jgi:hypothetical protein